MHGGLIQVAGSAGHLIGAAYRGSKQGMTDGTILIGGDVGSEIGARHAARDPGRRGLVRRRGRVQHDRRHHPRVRQAAGSGSAPACGEERSDSSAPSRPSCFPPSDTPAASDRSFFAFFFASWPGSVSRSTQARLDSEMLPLSRRPGRAGQGRGLDASGLTSVSRTRHASTIQVAIRLCKRPSAR